jgi:transposase
MTEEKKAGGYSIFVSESFTRSDEKCTYEVSFRRWLVQQLEEQKMSVAEAVKIFNFHPDSGRQLILGWRKKYAPETFVPLAEMTEHEKQKLAALQEQLKATEKQLEDARMSNIALNMLIDVAEEKLKIRIRKKPGAKQ